MMAFAIVELILKCWRELPYGVSKPVRALRFAFDGNQLGRFGRLSIFEVAPVAIDHKMRTKNEMNLNETNFEKKPIKSYLLVEEFFFTSYFYFSESTT